MERLHLTGCAFQPYFTCIFAKEWISNISGTRSIVKCICMNCIHFSILDLYWPANTPMVDVIAMPTLCMHGFVSPPNSTTLSPFCTCQQEELDEYAYTYLDRINKRITCVMINKYKKNHKLVVIISAKVYCLYLPPIIIIGVTLHLRFVIPYTLLVWILLTRTTTCPCITILGLVISAWVHLYLPKWRQYHFICYIS